MEGSAKLLYVLDLYERARHFIAFSIAETVSTVEHSMLVVDFDKKKRLEDGDVVVSGDELPELFSQEFIHNRADAISEFLRTNLENQSRFSTQANHSEHGPRNECKARDGWDSVSLENTDPGDCVVLLKPPYVQDGVLKHGFHLHFPKVFLSAADKARFFLAFPDLDPIARTPWLLYGSRKTKKTGTYIADHVRVRLNGSISEISVSRYFATGYLVTNRVTHFQFSPKQVENSLCKFLSIRDLGHGFCREHYMRRLRLVPVLAKHPAADPAACFAAVWGQVDFAHATENNGDFVDDYPENRSFDDIISAYNTSEKGSLFSSLEEKTRSGDSSGSGEDCDDDDDDDDENGDGDGDGGMEVGAKKPTVSHVTPGTVRRLRVEFPWVCFGESSRETCRKWKASGVLFANRKFPAQCVLESGPGGHVHGRRPVFFFAAKSGRVYVGCTCGRTVFVRSSGRRHTTVPTSVTINVPKAIAANANATIVSRTPQDTTDRPWTVLKRQKQGKPDKAENEVGGADAGKLTESMVKAWDALRRKFGAAVFAPDSGDTWLTDGRASATTSVCPISGEACAHEAAFGSRVDFWAFRGRVYMKCQAGCACPTTTKSSLPVLNLSIG